MNQSCHERGLPRKTRDLDAHIISVFYSRFFRDATWGPYRLVVTCGYRIGYILQIEGVCPGQGIEDHQIGPDQDVRLEASISKWNKSRPWACGQVKVEGSACKDRVPSATFEPTRHMTWHLHRNVLCQWDTRGQSDCIHDCANSRLKTQNIPEHALKVFTGRVA